MESQSNEQEINLKDLYEDFPPLEDKYKQWETFHQENLISEDLL